MRQAVKHGFEAQDICGKDCKRNNMRTCLQRYPAHGQLGVCIASLLFPEQSVRSSLRDLSYLERISHLLQRHVTENGAQAGSADPNNDVQSI